MLKKILLYYHTLRYLKAIQIRFQVYYFIRQKLRKIFGFKYQQLIKYQQVRDLEFKKSISSAFNYDPNLNQFEFLNLKKKYEGSIDWNEQKYGKLWTYYLNYFEFLHQPLLSSDAGMVLIEDYLNKLTNLKDGLEPYPTSLRAIHWIKFFSLHRIKHPKVFEALNAHLNLLLDNLEHHILGNHLLENGFALLFGAYFFDDVTLYKKAKTILITELEEQILPDGGHFELSPMYHQLMLFRVLDCINLIKHNNHFNRELLQLFQKKASIMFGWLQQITFSNGDIPLLNDSAFSVSPTTDELSEYAMQLGIEPNYVALKESGYRKINRGNYEIVIDVGNIGPDYIPGHAHSDTFSFVLYIQGNPFIVDTGTSTYNSGEIRRYERSTAAHNTVEINNQNQSEVWDSFRVGRRAKVLLKIENKDKIIAESDGYKRIGVKHNREFEFFDSSIRIHDSVQSDKSCHSISFLHFHPNIHPVIKENKIITPYATIKFNNNSLSRLSYFQYAPEFNFRVNAFKVEIEFNKKLTLDIEINENIVLK